MLTLKKNNAQSYSLVAERGLALERDKSVQAIIYRHRKRVDGYMYADSYRKGKWDGFTYNYKPSNIRAGFLRETIEHMNNFQIQWQWEDNKIPDSLPFYVQDEFSKEEFSEFCEKYIGVIAPKYKEKYGRDLEVRPYQIESCFKCLTHKLGVILHATGAGKSFTISLVLAFLFHKKLINKAAIVVPKQTLTTQFKNDLIDFGFTEKSIGVVLSNQKQTTRPITIIMNQSLHRMENTLEEDDFLGKVDFVVCDEVHTSAATTVTNGILKFINAKYFLGFTGTLPENELDSDIVASLFGYVLDQQKVKDLEGEVLAVVTVGILTFCYGAKGKDSRAKRSESTRDWNDEVKFLQGDDKFRNPFIVNMLVGNYNKGVNIVVLVKNIEYGMKIHQMISKTVKKNVYWIDGNIPLYKRDDIIDSCKNSTEPYIIVTNFQIFSTGVNIPNLNLVAMVDAGKSKITVAQTIGRGVRKTQYKSTVAILDCSCDLKYGAKHGRKRKQLYQEEGFKVIEKLVTEDPQLTDLENKIQTLKES